MTINKLFLAASLGFALAACAGEEADTAVVEAPVEAPAAGEIPQAGDEGIVTGSPAENVIGDETTADAMTVDPLTDPDAPVAPVDPLQQDPGVTTPPVLEGVEPEPVAPPPSQ